MVLYSKRIVLIFEAMVGLMLIANDAALGGCCCVAACQQLLLTVAACVAALTCSVSLLVLLQVIRCALENACSVAKTFLLADVVVTEIPERAGAAAPAGGADEYGY